MSGIESALVSQLAVVQQNAAMSMMKQAAQAQQNVADMVAQTVTASGRGQVVDLSA